jgi:hypothetical protein
MSKQPNSRAYFAARCRDKANPPSRIELQLIADLLDEHDDAAKKNRDDDRQRRKEDRS